MVEFKVGDKVRCIDALGLGILSGNLRHGSIHEVSYYGPGRMLGCGIKYVRVGSNAGNWLPERFELAEPRRMEAHKEEYRAAARAIDPATSKGKRKVNKYEEEVLAHLSLIGPSTGKEIASLSQQPLNCITPRFAPLRRKGLIKDSGVKRDKQIVWVLA